MLPTLIEYLSSQIKPGGMGRLCNPGRLQFNFPLLPPGFQLNFSIFPPFNSFAAIKYGMSYDAIPGNIYLEVSHGGNTYIAGIIENDHMIEILPYYILYTQSDPLQVLLQNQSVLNQAALGTQYMVTIATEEDCNAVKNHIIAYSSIETNRLAVEANRLLRAIAIEQGAEVPRDPITGGS